MRNEIDELEHIASLGCQNCYLSECQAIMHRNQRDAAEIRANRFKDIADFQQRRRERWRSAFYGLLALLVLVILKGWS